MYKIIDLIREHIWKNRLGKLIDILKNTNLMKKYLIFINLSFFSKFIYELYFYVLEQ